MTEHIALSNEVASLILEAGAEYRKTAPVRAVPVGYDFAVETPEGVMYAHAGDYLVTDVPSTHFWPVKRETFEKTYEPVSDEPLD